MNVNGDLIGKAEAFKKKEEDKKSDDDENSDHEVDNDAESDETSTQNTSFSQYGGVQDSPCLSLPTEISRTSPRVSVELMGDLGLYSEPRSRKASDVSDDQSPCWKSCVIFFPKGGETSPNNNNNNNNNNNQFSSPFEGLKLHNSTDAKEESTVRSKSRKPSKFLEGYASENPNSWQARTFLTGFHKAKSDICPLPDDNLWKKMKTKQMETKSMLHEDPDYIKKLLAKVIQDDDNERVQALARLGSF